MQGAQLGAHFGSQRRLVGSQRREVLATERHLTAHAADLFYHAPSSSSLDSSQALHHHQAPTDAHHGWFSAVENAKELERKATGTGRENAKKLMMLRGTKSAVPKKVDNISVLRVLYARRQGLAFFEFAIRQGYFWEGLLLGRSRSISTNVRRKARTVRA